MPTAFRVLTAIINDSSITNIAALLARSTSESWTATLTTNIEASSSYIIRTDDISANTVAHIARPSTASSVSDAFDFTLRHQLHNEPGTYVYHRVNCAGIGGTTRRNIGTGLTNPISSSQWDLTAPIANINAQGTLLAITGSVLVSTITAAPVMTTAAVYTLWAYITDECFMWAVNVERGQSGWPAVSGTMSGQYGPFLNSQYSPRDNWNNPSTPIIPVVIDNQNRDYTSILGAIATDWTAIANPDSTTASECPYSVVNTYLNTSPSTGTSWTTTSPLRVVWGLGERYSDAGGLTVTNAISTATSTDAQYGGVLNVTTFGAKVPDADLSGKFGYPLYPITFRRSTTNMMLGGNITERAKVYIFNGDYYPGDEYIYNNKTYVLWPLTTYGWTNRLAYAIPKE